MIEQVKKAMTECGLNPDDLVGRPIMELHRIKNVILCKFTFDDKDINAALMSLNSR